MKLPGATGAADCDFSSNKVKPTLKSVPKSGEMNPPPTAFSSSTPISKKISEGDFFVRKNFLGHPINNMPAPSPIFGDLAKKPPSYNQSPKGRLISKMSMIQESPILLCIGQ